MTEADLDHLRFGKNTPQEGSIGVDRIRPRATMDYVTEEARREVELLKASGLDIEIVDVDLQNHYKLDDEKQKLVDHAIATYSEIPDFAHILAEANPAVAAWHGMALATSPLALGIFYDTGNMERPSDGLSEQAILHEPLSIEGGKTATELVRDLQSEEDANVILERVRKFFEAGSLKEGTDDFGLTAHDIMSGSLDRIGDITRANVAIAMVVEHVLNNPDQYTNKGVVSVSLASGAAEPVFWLMNELRKHGIDINTLHLVDADPIAIAASVDRSGKYNLKDKLQPHRKNLFREPIDSYIEPKSADMVDMIGIVEYLKPKAAKVLLERAKTIVRPGGIIVFGNMLKSRPQQEWFEGLWPELQQRSITETLEIIESAGFSRDQVQVRLSKDGLYPMFAIKVPLEFVAETSKDPSDDVTRGLGRVASPASL